MKTFASKNVRAMTLIEVMIVVAVLMLLVALLLPLTARSRKSHRITCVSNLMQIGISFRIWTGDNGDRCPMQVSVTNGGSMEFVGTLETFRHFQVMSNELGTPLILLCPADKGRRAATNFTSDLNNSRISYFVGVDAHSDQPSMPLAGDRNVTLNGTTLTPGCHSLRTNDLIRWSKELHNDQGNVVLVDASPQQMTSASLPGLFQNSGVATNRLAIP